MWHICYIATVEYKNVTLRFLIPGYTRNLCDGAFGLVKNLLKKLDVQCTADMMKKMDYCPETLTVLEADDVPRTDWKEMLNAHFTIPCNIKMNSYCLFEARCEAPGTLFVKKYSDILRRTSFNVIKPGITAENVVYVTNTVGYVDKFKLSIPQLRKVRATNKKSCHQYLIEYV